MAIRKLPATPNNPSAPDSTKQFVLKVELAECKSRRLKFLQFAFESVPEQEESSSGGYEEKTRQDRLWKRG